MFWNCEADTVNGSTYTFMGLDAETIYTVEIYAYNIIGNSETRSTEVTTASPSVGFDHEMAEGIQIFPNPALDFLQIEGAPAEPSWKLFNLKGQVLSQGMGEKIDVGHLAPGIYLLRIDIDRDSPEFFRIVKE
jgi:hypothetical protein